MEIVVVGGTGTVGAHLVALLAAEGHAVRVATRRPGQADPFPPGARPVELDLGRPETWRPALEGAERLFHLTPPGTPEPDRVAAALLVAMREAGVGRVVDMTGHGIDRMPSAPMRKLELAVEASGLPYTHVRPNYFLQNFCLGALRRGIVERDEIAVAIGEGRISYVDARDIAAVAAAALLRDGVEGRALEVTGPAGVTHAEIAAALSAATGRTIRFRDVGAEEMRATLLAFGLPEAAVEARLRFLALARSGVLAEPSPDVERVLGRPARTVADFARDHAAAFVPTSIGNRPGARDA